MTLPTPFTSSELTQAMESFTASPGQLPTGWQPTLYHRLATVLEKHQVERGNRGMRPQCTCGDEGLLVATGTTSATAWHRAHVARALVDEIENPTTATTVVRVVDTVRKAEWADPQVRTHVEATLRARLVAECTRNGVRLLDAWPPMVESYWVGLSRTPTIEAAEIVQVEIEALACTTEDKTAGQDAPPAPSAPA
jgi:hypothetical protein